MAKATGRSIKSEAVRELVSLLSDFDDSTEDAQDEDDNHDIGELVGEYDISMMPQSVISMMLHRRNLCPFSQLLPQHIPLRPTPQLLRLSICKSF